MPNDPDHMNQRVGFIDKAVDYFKYHQDQADKAISVGDETKLARHESKMEKLSEQIAKTAGNISSIISDRNNK